MAQVIAICGWEKFQHYTNRDPPWVKLYRDLLTSESWVLGTDISRLVQVASILLAARYKNKIPFNWPLLKRVASLDLTVKQFAAAIQHLAATNFLEIKEETLNASSALATCASDIESPYSEESRAEAEQRQSREDPPTPHGGVLQPASEVFEHWKKTWDHPNAVFDGKRRKRIEARLQDFTAEQLCEAISGFRNSPWHRGTDPHGGGKVYDGIDTLLRDTAQVEEGLRLLAHPPRAPPKPETASARILRTLNGTDDSQVIEHDPSREPFTIARQ